MCRDASAAKRIISTAPIAKFGATNALARRAPRRPRAAPRGRSRWCRSRRARRRRAPSRALPSAWSGRVKSTTTSASSSTSAERRAERRIGAARRARGPRRASTAAHTAWPMRPAAPATATRVTPRAAPRPGRRGATASRNASSSGPMPAADSALGRPQLLDERAQVVQRDGVDAGHDLVDLEQRQAVEHRARRAGSCAPPADSSAEHDRAP